MSRHSEYSQSSRTNERDSLTPDATVADAAVWVAPAALVPWSRNPRKNAAAIAPVAESIRRFGFGAPIVARAADLRVIAGHTRLAAAKQIGLERVPVRLLDVSEEDADALSLADNRLGEIAEWDDEALRALLAGGLELGELGWSDEEIEAIAHGFEAQPIQDDEAPPPQEGEPASRRGELYQLGRHRLLCGDCRDSDTVRILVGESRIDLAFTSPPYASQREYDPGSGFVPIPASEYVDWFDAVQGNVAAVLAQNGSWVVNIKEASEGGRKQDYVKRMVLRHIDEWGWLWIEEYCWPRPSLPLNPNDSRRFKNGWESVYHFARTNKFRFRPDAVRHDSDAVFDYAAQKRAGKMIGGTAQGVGGGIMSPVGQHAGLAYPSNVLDVARGGAKVVGHSAAFPVGLPDFFIRALTDDGGSVLDPFLGSGTTLIAAEARGRVWTSYAKSAGIDPGPGALE